MKNKVRIPLIITVALVAWCVISHWPDRLTAIEPWESEEMEAEDHLAQTIEGRYEQEFLMTRDPATNTIPRERLLTAYRVAQDKRAQMAQAEKAIPIYWQERGPNNVGGRTRGLLIDANDATGRTIWAGSVAGGLWRTTNIDAGTPTWTSINDFFANLAITTIAQDPTNANLLYFGTGEGFGNYDAVSGLGTWRSTNGGATWARLPVNFSNISKIMFDNAGRVYAATNNGLLRSTDGGLTWPVQLNGNIQDFEIAANGDLFATRNGDGIYRFPTGGTVWGKLTSILPTSNFGRIEVATAPSNASVLYAVFQKTTNPNANTALGLFQSTDGGTTWIARSVPGNFGSQAWYDLIMAVDPNDPNRVWAGGVGMSVSGDQGVNWTGVGVHSDHHGIVYRPGSSDEMVFGNDGGVYRCTDGSVATPTLTNKNNTYNVTQFLSTALHPTAGNNYILGGTQDNGTQRFTSAGINSTSQPSGAGGDGGYSFIDQDNASVQIAAYVNRLFFVSTDGGANFSGLTSTNAPSLFITPAEYDDASNIFYYSSNADTLGRRANVGAGGAETFERITQFGNGRASAITVSPNTANRLYVGTENGNFVRIDNADQPGAITVTALTSPRAAYISCVVVEPGNDNHLLATCSNYGNAGQIFESTDGGVNWVNLTNDFPDMPVRWAIFHPFDADKVLLATELGVWSTDDLNGVNTRWWPTSNFGLANVRVDMLQYRPSDHLVAAATHGRGMFTTDYFTLLNTCVPNLNISGAVAPGIYMAQDFITSNGVISPGKKVIYHAGNYIQLTPGFRAQSGSDFWAVIEPCGIGPKPLATKPQEPASNLLTNDRSNSDTSQDGFGQLAVRCYPNPVAYRLFVEYDLPSDGSYSLYVRNIQGQLIETFAVGKERAAGRYQIELDAQNYQAGIYVLTLQTAQKAVTERFLVSR